MLDDLELSLMAFPQSWTKATGTLAVNLIVLPVGDPTGPVGSVPVFAGTTLKLTAQLLTGGALPSTTATSALSAPYAAAPPAVALPLLRSMATRLPTGATLTTGKVTAAQAPPATVRVMKALPTSYTQAFPFSRPRDPALFVVGDGYGCAVEAQAPPITVPSQPKPPPPPPTIAWGQLLSYILRQPLLAQACGLLYQTQLALPATLVKDVSWIHFSIDTSVASNPFASDVAANPDSVRSYAARLPPLNGDRRLFAAALFPVVPTTSALLAGPDAEAQIYDDGFAQIVHAFQPPTFDAATGAGGIPPGAEAGIQLAWDDEQVTIWLDRQIGVLRDRATHATTPTTAESPLGVVGYRIDVSPSGANAWASLCGVTGNLPFSAGSSTGAGATTLPPGTELTVTPSPVRAQPTGSGPSAEPTWLPLYFAAWRGASLVTDDPTYGALNPPDKAPPPGQPIGNSFNTKLPSTALRPANLPPAPSYGQSYDFRVRLVDLSGGGPSLIDGPVHPGLAPIATAPFRRYIPPKALVVATTPAPPPLPAKPVAVRTITKLAVQRPRIGYPEALFAGVDPSQFEGAALTALVNSAFAGNASAGVPDPDVDRFSVVVEAAIPDHDAGPPGALPGDIDGAKWRIIYSVSETFPGPGDPVVQLALSYVDTLNVAAMSPPSDGATTLPIPTARDVRIRLVPLLAAKSGYYGEAVPPPGPSSDYIVRKEAASETGLFPFVPVQQLRAAYLQPGGDLGALIAQSFGLEANGLTLTGAPGVRTVFAVSGALRATLSPDLSSITFANGSELLGHWIVALTIDIARDWTWDGFAAPGLSLSRNGATPPIATLVYPGVIAPTALGDVANPADRTTTQIVFLDAIDPQPAPGAFPVVLNPSYSVTASFRTAPAITQTWTTLQLPIVTTPALTPKIVASGIAESAYVAAPDYSSTEQRDRFLWIEFDAPIADTADDTYFGRVLAYGPDPLLAGALLPPNHAPDTEPEPPLAIDPETVRVVFAGEDTDESGLAAMTELTPASATSSGPEGVHYLLPLPAGLTPDALALFGFWTYEFRVGHAQKWSTAQGRYGRPLRVAGVQHPPPPLVCTIWRNDNALTVTAPFATTLLNGVPAISLAAGDPQTALWFMLYTQVTQTDGASQRNILIGRTLGSVMTVTTPGVPPALLPNREPRGRATFQQTQIAAMLGLLGLPATAPLSALAVEILPGPIHTPTGGLFAAAPNAAVAAPDPLGAGLGSLRILRTSPLTTAPAIC